MVVVERYVVVEPRTRVVTCDRPTISRDLVGGTLGGALGGLIGSRFGQGQGKIVAAVGGTILGVFAGQHVARSIDWADEACAQRVVAARHRSPREDMATAMPVREVVSVLP